MLTNSSALLNSRSLIGRGPSLATETTRQIRRRHRHICETEKFYGETEREAAGTVGRLRRLGYVGGRNERAFAGGRSRSSDGTVWPEVVSVMDCVDYNVFSLLCVLPIYKSPDCILFISGMLLNPIE